MIWQIVSQKYMYIFYRLLVVAHSDRNDRNGMNMKIKIKMKIDTDMDKDMDMDTDIDKDIKKDMEMDMDPNTIPPVGLLQYSWNSYATSASSRRCMV